MNEIDENVALAALEPETVVIERIDELEWTAAAREAVKVLARRKIECSDALRAQVDASVWLNALFPNIGARAAQELDELAFSLAAIIGDKGAQVSPDNMRRLQALDFIKITVSP